MAAWVASSVPTLDADHIRQRLWSDFERDRLKRFFICLAVDAIGLFTYAVPVLGESFDVIWAPIAAVINFAVNGGMVGFLGGLVTMGEEVAPGTDIIPSLTLTWFVKYVLGSSSAFQEFAASRSSTRPSAGSVAGDALTIYNQTATAMTVWLEVLDAGRNQRVLDWTIPPGSSISPGAEDAPIVCDGTIRFCARSTDGTLAWHGDTIVRAGEEVYALREIAVPRKQSGGYALTLRRPDPPAHERLPLPAAPLVRPTA